MALTPQTRAIGIANDVCSIAQNVWKLEQTLVDLVNKNIQQSVVASGIWQKFPTTTINNDGSLGIADNSPVADNPIDTRVASMAGLHRSATYNDYVDAYDKLTVDLLNLLTSGSFISAMAPFQGQ